MPNDSHNPEIDLGLGKVSEVTQEQVEQFQEQLKAAQAALAQLQKDEGKAKKKDVALAGLLSRFIKKNQDHDVLQSIIQCLNIGIPVNFIIALLSLGYEEINQAITQEMKKKPLEDIQDKEKAFLHRVEEEEQKDLSSPKKTFDEHLLPEDVKSRINEWVKDILLLSLENKKKTLSTVYAEQKPNLEPLQLSTLVLNKYLFSLNIEGTSSRIQAFSAFILTGIGKELAK